MNGRMIFGAKKKYTKMGKVGLDFRQNVTCFLGSMHTVCITRPGHTARLDLRLPKRVRPVAAIPGMCIISGHATPDIMRPTFLFELAFVFFIPRLRARVARVAH